MRTTMTLDDDVASALRELARNGGEPFKKIVNDLLRLGLRARTAPPETRPYELTPASLGRLRAGVDLDKAMALAGSLEDEEIVRKLELRK